MPGLAFAAAPESPDDERVAAEAAHLRFALAPAHAASTPAADPAKVELGKLLFFDKLLSGNRNVSCATCHHPMAATGDGVSLGIGAGGHGLGVMRTTAGRSSAIADRVPRNAPPVFNLGLPEITVLFHDGRVALAPSHPKGFTTPAGDALPAGLDSVLAAQAMFPVTSPVEMAGQPGENAQADRGAASDFAGVWQILAEKIRAVPGYVDRFVAVYGNDPRIPVRGAADITFVHAANAIAAFESDSWKAQGSPFDRFFAGDAGSMSPRALRGMTLFYGRARCGTCHQGTLQTDQAFHSIGMPQIGPGKGDGPDGRDDFGRERVTKDARDRFKFRTPSLRNVAVTGPWGHDGAFDSLEGVIRHHLDPAGSMESYDRTQAVLPSDAELARKDFVVMDDPARRHAISRSSELGRANLRDDDMKNLVEFLRSLTDPASLDLRKDVPAAVPSGLPVFD